MSAQATFAGQPAFKLHTGAAMPAFGLGTWLSPKDKVKAAVIHAIKGGYRHIDCAATYQNEDVIGEALKELFDEGVVKREDLFITSKLWISEATPEDAPAALKKTLQDLQLDYLDMYLIHFPYFLKKGAGFPPSPEDRRGYSPEAYAAVWKTLEAEVDAGRLRHIGTSNMSVKKLKDLLAVARIKPANNQVELHPLLQQKELIKFCHDNGIVVTAYSPLGNPTRPDLFKKEGHLAPLEDPKVLDIASKHGVTAAQVLIKWAIQRGTVVIPKSVTPERIDANIKSLNVNLSEEDMSKIETCDKHMRFLDGEIFMPPGQHWKQLWDEE